MHIISSMHDENRDSFYEGQLKIANKTHTVMIRL